MSSYLINKLIFMLNFALFFFMYLIRFHLVINRDDWFILWIGLEVNIITFIIFIYKENRIIRIESCLKYFFIQRVGSAIFLTIFYLNKEWLDFIICFLLSYKIGAGPFFFWFPSVCSNISWISCFMLISFQKIIPLVIISFFFSVISYIVIIVGLFFGVFGSFNQKNLKQLIAFSSIYHLGWVILCNFSEDVNWIIYLTVYSIMIFPVIIFFKYLLFEDLSIVMKVKYKSIIILLLLSMAGIPPFLGFFLKWFAFVILFECRFYYIIFLIICSIVIFYVYFRIIYDVLIRSYDSGVWKDLMMIKRENNFFILLRILGLIVGLFFGVFFIL